MIASGNTLEVIDEVTVTSGENTQVINEQDIAVTMETAADWDFTNTMEEWDFDTFDSTTVVDEDAGAFTSVVENFEF